MRDLTVATTLGLINGFTHRISDLVAVQNRGAVDMSRRAPDGLNQRPLGAQKTLLVCIQNRHQRHLGNVQSFTQQVDADQHIKFAEPQIANDFHAFDGVDIRVQIPRLDAVLV